MSAATTCTASLRSLPFEARRPVVVASCRSANSAEWWLNAERSAARSDCLLAVVRPDRISGTTDPRSSMSERRIDDIVRGNRIWRGR
jgi:hypothetical protein